MCWFLFLYQILQSRFTSYQNCIFVSVLLFEFWLNHISRHKHTQLYDTSVTSCPLSPGRPRHHGNGECFLWMRMMKKPCCLIAHTTSSHCGQSVGLPQRQINPTPISLQLSLSVLLRHLVDKTRTAERAVPYCCTWKLLNQIVWLNVFQIPVLYVFCTVN